MKTILALTLLLHGANLHSQDCKTYYYLQNNKTVEMSLYDKKGDMSGRLVYSITDVINSNNLTTATMQSQIFDKKGRTIAKGNGVMKCNGGVMMINMKMMIPTPQAEQFSKANAKTDDFFIEYPVNMNKGDQLKDGTMNMEMDNNGLQQSITMTVYDRKVEDKEKVTTPAGAWDCYKISYKSKMTVKIMGVGVPMNLDGTEWYAPGFGVVKTNSKHGSTEITSIK
jgi:hypothetical protein